MTCSVDGRGSSISGVGSRRPKPFRKTGILRLASLCGLENDKYWASSTCKSRDMRNVCVWGPRTGSYKKVSQPTMAKTRLRFAASKVASSQLLRMWPWSSSTEIMHLMLACGCSRTLAATRTQMSRARVVMGLGGVLSRGRTTERVSEQVASFASGHSPYHWAKSSVRPGNWAVKEGNTAGAVLISGGTIRPKTTSTNR